jgi:hypothetical protein
MDNPAAYLQWAFVYLSVPNLVVIGVMILVFALALLLPFPGEREDQP